MAEDRIFVNQDALQFYIDAEMDISTATKVELKYRKPGGTEGVVTGSLDSTQYVKYDMVQGASFLDTSGWWYFWVYITFADGRKAPGIPFKRFVYEEGTLK